MPNGFKSDGFRVTKKNGEYIAEDDRPNLPLNIINLAGLSLLCNVIISACSAVLVAKIFSMSPLKAFLILFVAQPIIDGIIVILGFSLAEMRDKLDDDRP